MVTDGSSYADTRRVIRRLSNPSSNVMTMRITHTGDLHVKLSRSNTLSQRVSSGEYWSIDSVLDVTHTTIPGGSDNPVVDVITRLTSLSRAFRSSIPVNR